MLYRYTKDLFELKPARGGIEKGVWYDLADFPTGLMEKSDATKLCFSRLSYRTRF